MIKFHLLGFLCLLSLFACRNNVIKDADNNLDTLNYKYDSLTLVSPIKSQSFPDQDDSTFVKILYPTFNNELINQSLIKTILNSSGPEKNTNSLNALAEDFIKSYEAFRKDFPDRPQTWYLLIEGRVLKQSPNYLSLELKTEEYAGGAHGNSFINYLNFDPNRGSPLILDDFLLPNSYAELLTIAEDTFRTQEGLKDGNDYQNYFFEDGKFALASNYKLSENGLEFIYNNYEIKPYSDGVTKLILPYEKINHLLKSTYKSKNNKT